MSNFAADDAADAFETQLLAAAPALLRFARYLTGSAADAEDLAQETCARAIGSRDGFRPGTRLDSWLYRIAQNTHRNAIRAGKVRARHLEEAIATAPIGADGGAEAATELSAVRARIARLPVEQRKVLLLVAEGHRYAEVAEILGVPIGTVMSRLSRARATLKEMRHG